MFCGWCGLVACSCVRMFIDEAKGAKDNEAEAVLVEVLCDVCADPAETDQQEGDSGGGLVFWWWLVQ